MDLEVYVEAGTVQSMLTRIAAATSQPSMAAWLSGPMTQVLQRRAQERFVNQGEDVSGGGWKAWEKLSDATIAFRAAAGYGPTPINVRTGEMERYVTGAAGQVNYTGVGVSMVWPGDSPGGILGEKVARAQGRDKPKVPERKIIGLSGPDVELALVSLHGWIEAAMSGRGRA